MIDIVVTVTSKGQATIPKKLRNRHKIGKKALVVDTKEGVLLKPVPDPLMEKGSLKKLLDGKTSRELINEARSEEVNRDRKLFRGGKSSHEHSA